MLIRHIYQTMNNSESSEFPDVMTFPVNNFVYTEIPTKVVVTENNIIRFDLFVYNFYGVSYYDDLILWLNNIEFKDDLIIGQELLLPIKRDLDRFFIDYSVTEN